MKRRIKSKFTYVFGSIVASFAWLITIYSMNTACIYITHQSKIPDSAKKLRKF